MLSITVFFIASEAQLAMHLPQPVHFTWSIRAPACVIRMAPEGHS